MNRSSGLLPAVLLGAIAGLSIWLERSVSIEPSAQSPAKDSMDAWATDVKVRRFDMAGRLQHMLDAEQLKHYSGIDALLLHNARLIIEGEPRTVVSAANARVASGGKQVDLDGHVNLRQNYTTNAKSPWLVTTARMTIFPETGQANGNTAVRISQDSTVITGSGFSTNHETGVTVLKGRVNAEFKPGSRR